MWCWHSANTFLFFIVKLNPLINYSIYKVKFSNHYVCWKRIGHFLWSKLCFRVRLHFLGLGQRPKHHHPRKWSPKFIHSSLPLPSVLRPRRPQCNQSSSRFGHYLVSINYTTTVALLWRSALALLLIVHLVLNDKPVLPHVSCHSSLSDHPERVSGGPDTGQERTWWADIFNSQTTAAEQNVVLSQ